MNYPKPEILSLPAIKTSAAYVSVPGYGSFQHIVISDPPKHHPFDFSRDRYYNGPRLSKTVRTSFEETKLKPWRAALLICVLLILAPALPIIINEVLKIRNKRR